MMNGTKEEYAYAALILIETSQISEKFSIDWIKDRPDLQISDFGIEVTCAIAQEDGEQRKHDSDVPKCKTYESAVEHINNLKHPGKYRSEPKQIPFSERFSLSSGGGYDEKKPINIIVEAIKKKSKKFHKYPDHKRFSRRGLYIFDDELRPAMDCLDTEIIMKEISDSIFDVVFIHQMLRLVVIKKCGMVTKEYPLDKTTLLDAECEAKRVCDSPDYKICCERTKLYKELIAD